VVIQEDCWKQAEFGGRTGSEPLDDLPETLIFLVLVRLRQIEVQLVAKDFGAELPRLEKSS
jgi:hypothetical protein